jgi:hypothetical protein
MELVNTGDSVLESHETSVMANTVVLLLLTKLGTSFNFLLDQFPSDYKSLGSLVYERYMLMILV